MGPFFVSSLQIITNEILAPDTRMLFLTALK